ncbi:MAG: hypothetical protein QMC90_04475 [Dehalococcoidales bacterium]|nr:hypothetical protein [Dehalococcoidales bacterium]
MATHDVSQGQRLADRIGVLINGEKPSDRGFGERYSLRPGNREVAEFVGIENIIGVIVASKAGVVAKDIGGKVIETVSGYSVGEEVCACVRPEDITLTLPPALR